MAGQGNLERLYPVRNRTATNSSENSQLNLGR